MSTSLDIQNASNLASLVANQAIVSPFGDPYTIGISGFIFDIIGRVRVKASSDVTDHFVEENYATQDHVALKPIIVTMEGKAAEVVSIYQPNIIQQIFSNIGGLLSLVGLGPTFNTQDSAFYSALNSVAQIQQNIVNTTLNAFQIFQNAVTLVTKQQTAYKFIMGMRNNRTLCTVETPFNVFENMIIEDLDCEQTEETTKISDFIIRFKQIMTVASIQGTTSANSTDSQNSGTTSTISPTTSDSLNPYVADAVSVGSGYGTATDTNTMLGVFQNQNGK